MLLQRGSGRPHPSPSGACWVQELESRETASSSVRGAGGESGNRQDVRGAGDVIEMAILRIILLRKLTDTHPRAEQS